MPIWPKHSLVLAVIEAKTMPGCSLASSRNFKRFLRFSSWAEADDEVPALELDPVESEELPRLRLLSFLPFAFRLFLFLCFFSARWAAKVCTRTASAHAICAESQRWISLLLNFGRRLPKMPGLRSARS